ncbi:MAG: YciI family protein [Thaumarchaeota archaeon]|nr:YciI family protein [Nitrososphaerota archaeon]
MPFFVIFETNIASIEEVQRHRSSHLDYIGALHKKGKIFAAGRFLDGTGGMIIASGESMEEAEKIARNDPYVVKKIRNYTIKPWDKVF